MTKQTVIVRDRADGRFLQLRQLEEPVKLRLCRACLRAHPPLPAACTAAA